ncbi:MAG: hypothetical protein EOP09_05685 [Proteobacteria bacterium]|nr:MAG: hypothetical protein EOP09_05685 [Pseudomonadota bacterium]
MNQTLLIDAVQAFCRLDIGTPPYARIQAVRQFNALLEQAKNLYPSRPDINAINNYIANDRVICVDLVDASKRLLASLELRRPGALSEAIESISLPSDAPEGLTQDLEELKLAVSMGLRKSALLLSGSLAEALLLSRHPDRSERGPGLSRLLALATEQRLFGRDVLRHLETLNDYRDLIHTRAAQRNRITLTDERVILAVQALKLLCAELQYPNVFYA